MPRGGCCLDPQPATIEALLRIIEVLSGRGSVSVDGGIRRGTDIVKAIALGAAAVPPGVTHLLNIPR